eukprot:CAMPEP_0119527584 /NCGR_PEP_ID=MMETSP1344-20130328/41956_1 /TAXON_ID=236787 /ORGANISM="Florenciella parvula, Strain CCMP2471" /LENGTH=141 /DNA_ID=CAMNT_0007566801 /DNA_START=9 /DNA_END=431 /DNA_ORIENTATION=-
MVSAVRVHDPRTQYSMDTNFQKILRLSGWTRCLLIAYITMMYMSVLHANIATTQHVGTAKWRPAGTTKWRPSTTKCQCIDFTEAPRPQAELRAKRADHADTDHADTKIDVTMTSPKAPRPQAELRAPRADHADTDHADIDL